LPPLYNDRWKADNDAQDWEYIDCVLFGVAQNSLFNDCSNVVEVPIISADEVNSKEAGDVNEDKGVDDEGNQNPGYDSRLVLLPEELNKHLHVLVDQKSWVSLTLLLKQLQEVDGVVFLEDPVVVDDLHFDSLVLVLLSVRLPEQTHVKCPGIRWNFDLVLLFLGFMREDFFECIFCDKSRRTGENKGVLILVERPHEVEVLLQQMGSVGVVPEEVVDFFRALNENVGDDIDHISALVEVFRLNQQVYHVQEWLSALGLDCEIEGWKTIDILPEQHHRQESCLIGNLASFFDLDELILDGFNDVVSFNKVVKDGHSLYDHRKLLDWNLVSYVFF
jgi:hypothetical protein